MPGPLVSILMPLYNEEAYLAPTLDSLLAQDQGNFELLISDNSSTDRTWEIVERYAKQDSRILCQRQASNVGSARNMRSLLPKAQGRYMMMAAGHDLWRPRFISSCTEALSADSSVIMAYARAEWIDSAGRVLGAIAGNFDTRGLNPPWRLNLVLWGLMSSFQAYGIFRREAFESIPTEPMLAGDNFWLAQCALDGVFAQTQEVLFSMRMLEDYGNWETYQRKIYGPAEVAPTEEPHLRYFTMVQAFQDMIARRLPAGFERDALMLTATNCLLTKYVALLAGVERAAAKSNALQDTLQYVAEAAREAVAFVGARTRS